MAKQQDPLRKLYDVVSAPDVQLYTKDYESFKAKYSSDQEIDNLFNTISAPDIQLYTKDLNSFKSQYFPSLGKQTGVSERGSVGTSQTSVGPTPNIQNSENVLSQLSASSSELSLPGSIAQTSPMADPTNIQDPISQANRVASEYGVEGELFEVEPIEGSEYRPGYVDPLTNRLISNYRVDLETGEASNVIPTVDITMTRQEAMDRNAMMEQERLEQVTPFQSVVNTVKSTAPGLRNVLDGFIMSYGAPISAEDAMYTGWTPEEYRQVQKDVESQAYEHYAEVSKDLEKYRTLGIVDSWRNGNLPGVLSGAFNAFASLARSAAITSTTGGAGLYAEMTAPLLHDTVQERVKSSGGSIKEVLEGDGIDSALAISRVLGIANAVSERVGLKGLGKFKPVKDKVIPRINNFFRNSPSKAAGVRYAIDVVGEGGTELFQEGVTSVNELLAENPNASVDEISSTFWDALGTDEGMESFFGGVAAKMLMSLAGIKRGTKFDKINNTLAGNKDARDIGRQYATIADENGDVMPGFEPIAERLQNRLGEILEKQYEQESSLTLQQKQRIGNAKEKIVNLQNTRDSLQNDPEATPEQISLIDEEIENLSNDIDRISSEEVNQAEIDKRVESFRENNPSYSNVDVFSDIPQSVESTLNRMDNNLPVDPVAVNEASSVLYGKYKELQAMKMDERRLMTTEEINQAMDGLAADIEKLENFTTEVDPDATVVSNIEPVNNAINQQESLTQEGGQIDETQQPRVESTEITMEGSQVAPLGETDSATQELVNEVTEPVVETGQETGPQNQDVDAPAEQIRPRSEFANETEYYRSLAESTDDAQVIADAYNDVLPVEPNYIEQGISDYLGNGKINEDGYNRFGDRNNLDASKKSRWIDTSNSRIDIDVMAQELSDQLGVEVTPEDIIDFVDRYAGQADFNQSKKSEAQVILENRYRELTGRNLTQLSAERARRAINESITNEDIAAVNEGLQELGITYQDILNYEEYIEGTIGRAEQSLQPETNEVRSNSVNRSSQESQRTEVDAVQNQETVQENEQAPVRAEEIQEDTTDTEDAAIRPIRESYERLTEGMTPEQIDADPDLVRMRDRISPPEQVESADPEATTDTVSSQDAEQAPEPSLTRDAKGKVKPLTEIAKSAKARKARMDELRERIEKNKSSLSNLGIAPNNRKKAEQWRDITDYAILSLIEGTVNTSRQLADALGLPHSKRLIQAFSEAKNDLFNNREVYGDISITAAKNAENARRRAEYGFDERITPVAVGFDKVQQEADRMIREGYDVNELIDRAIANEPLNATEVTILTRYAQEVEMNIVKANEVIESNPNTNVTTNRDNIDRRNKAIDDMYRVIGALEASGTVAARALNIRKALLARDMSLGGMLSEYRAAVGNRNLTSDEIQDINERYTRIVDIKQKLERRNSELEVENARLDAELELARQRYEAELDYRKRKDRSKTKTEQIKDIKKRRETAKANLSKALSEVFSGSLGLAMDPKKQAEQQIKSDVSIAKALRELVRTYIDEAITRAGKVDFDWVIDRIHADVKESVPTATREQVMNLIDSSNPDERPTKTQLQREVARFRNELSLLNKIRELEKGGVFTSKKRKAINDERLTYLRNRLNELRKRNNDTEVKGKTDEQKAIESLKKRIAESRRKINERDFAPERKQLVLNDPEVKRLQKELNKEQFRFKVEVRKEEYRNRNIFFKVSGTLREIVAVPRTLMATGDLSAPLRQTAFIIASRPLQIIPAIGRMFQFYGSKKAYDDYFDAFKETADYDLMVKAGVSLTDVAPNIGAAAREEQFMSSFVANMEKFIPGIGGGEVEYNGKKYKVPGLQIHGRAERGFTGYINKVRIDLFTHGAELLMRDGKFPDAYMSDYKKLATYVNAVTGRGPMPEQWSGIMADLSSVFFAPRLMTSRLWLIAGGPLWTGNKITRQMYLRDLTTFVAFGSLAMAAASLAGAEVIGDDDDETLLGEGAADSWTNSDFGNIVVGDTRYDVWGGFGQYVRFFSRLAFGQKTATTGRVTKFNTDEWGSETYADLALRFGRSKLSPTASLISSAMVGKNYMGEPFSLQQELLNMASPLVWQDTYEAWTDQNEGVKSMYTTFLPSFFGMGVQTWEANSFIKKGVDDKIGDMLNEKKVATRIKDVTNVRFYDPEKGEERQPTTKELEKFSDTWAEYVKSDLEENYDKYKKMSSDAFDTRFTSIKSAATAFAKKHISGVSTYDLVIESNDIQYRLTPEQVRERLKMNERFIKENRSDFKDLERDYIQSGMDPDKAKIEAEKKMESAARRYSRGQILEAVESGRMQLQEK